MPFTPTSELQPTPELGDSKNFLSLGALAIPTSEVEKLPSGISKDVSERYEHVKQGIFVFNSYYHDAIDTDDAKQFQETTQKLKATIKDANASLKELGAAVRARVEKDASALHSFTYYLSVCDHYHREEVWEERQKTIHGQENITPEEKKRRIAKLNFLKSQWREHDLYAHYPAGQLIKLVAFSKEFEEVLNRYLRMENQFNTEAKFFFDDVRKVLVELKKQREILACAAYHRLRIAKKRQDPEFSDLVVDLRDELKLLGITENTLRIRTGNINLRKAIDTNPRRELQAKLNPADDKKIEEELSKLVREYGTDEVVARLSNLSYYEASSATLAIPVQQFEKNVLFLPGVFVIGKNAVSFDRIAEFNLENDDFALSKEEKQNARKKNLGWWDRWTQCQYDLTSHRDFRLYNAIVRVIQSKQAFKAEDIAVMVKGMRLTPAESEALQDPVKANRWVKDNADRLLALLDPDTKGSPVPNSWASFSWLRGTGASKVKKIITSYKKILEKAKEGSVQYPVPTDLVDFIPLDKGKEGSHTRVRHDLFFGTTFIAQFNELAFSIRNDFEQRFNGLNRPDKNINPLTKLETTLRLKEIAAIEKIIIKMEAQINNNMPSYYNPANWFSGEASKTREMLTLWQGKVDQARKDIEEKRLQIAKFIAKNIEKYIDETAVDAIDTALLERLQKFIDDYGTEDDKITYKKATTISGVFTKYVEKMCFIIQTQSEPKENIAIDVDNVKRILALAPKLSPSDATVQPALSRICNIIEGKSYPQNRRVFINDLKVVLNTSKIPDKLLEVFINSIVKPFWNPYAENAQIFIKALFGEEQFAEFQTQNTKVNLDLHTLMIEFLSQKELLTLPNASAAPAQTVSVTATVCDIQSTSEVRYHNRQTRQAYYPARIFAYIAHHNPRNISQSHEHAVVNEQESLWRGTIDYARSHALQQDVENDEYATYGCFNGCNTYAAELISSIDDFQSIYNYTKRLLQGHLKREHNKYPVVRFVLPPKEEERFLNKHPQATLMGYIQALYEYVSSAEFKGESSQYAQLIVKICAVSLRERVLATDDCSAQDMLAIQNSLDSIKTKSRETILRWGMKRFEWLIQNENHTITSGDDHNFYHAYLANEPQLKEQLKQRVFKWIFTDKAYDGRHNAFWKIISWLGDYESKPTRKGVLINAYATVRLAFLFKNNQALTDNDEQFLEYNQNVEGFLLTVATGLLKYLSEPNCAGDHHYYLNLVLWLKARGEESDDADLKDRINRVIAAYADKRFRYLFSQNTSLTPTDWDYLNRGKDVSLMTDAVKNAVSDYVSTYEGSTTTFTSLILGHARSFTGKVEDQAYLFQPYTQHTAAANYAAKRLRWLMKNGQAFNADDYQFSELFNEPSRIINDVKDIVADTLRQLIASPKIDCWTASNTLVDATIQQYTAIIYQIVTNQAARSIAQLSLMEQYAPKRLWTLMCANQLSLTEQPFFSACLSENSVKRILTETVARNFSGIIGLDNFRYLSIINELESTAITVYYVKRLEHLFKNADKTAFPDLEIENLKRVLQRNPLLQDLNENLKGLLTKQIRHHHINKERLNDQRIVQLLSLLALRPENEQYVADHVAMMLDKYLEKKTEPPTFFRELCLNNKSNKLQKELDEVVRIHFDRNNLLAEWNAKHPEKYVIAHTHFQRHDNLWYKVVMNYASDQTYDECIVPLLNTSIQSDNKASLAILKTTLQQLAQDHGNRRRAVPATDAGRQQLDTIIGTFIYQSSDSKAWNITACEVVEDGCCSETQKDNYRCGELVRRLVTVGTNKKEFNEFFEVADKANWDRKDVEARTTFVSTHSDRLNRAFIYCVDTMPWHGNAQRIIHNYAKPEIATAYHAKWYLTQLEHRQESFDRYQQQKEQNYSFLEDESNRQNYPSASRLLAVYGMHLETIVNRTELFLEQMKLDNVPAIHIVESHFSRPAEPHSHQQRLQKLIERYNFVMTDILNDWKNSKYADATAKLKSKSSLIESLRAVQPVASTNESRESLEQKAKEQRKWEKSCLKKIKHCAEDYIKYLLQSEVDSPARREKVIKVARSFIDGLPPSHKYKKTGEFLYDLSKGNEASLFAAINCAEASAKIQLILDIVAQTPLSSNLTSYDANNLLDVFSIENAQTLARNLPQRKLNIIITSLNQLPNVFNEPHPLSSIAKTFAEVLATPVEQATANQPNRTDAFELFAAVVSINRQLNKYFDLSVKRKAADTLLPKQVAEFERVLKDPAARSYFIYCIDRLLADRGHTIQQRDEFEIDKWQDEFVKRLGKQEQIEKLTHIKRARIVYKQLEEFLTDITGRPGAVVNLNQFISKSNPTVLAQQVVSSLSNTLPACLKGTLRQYFDHLVISLGNNKVASDEIKVWPFLLAFIIESDLHNELSAQISFFVAKALTLLNGFLSIKITKDNAKAIEQLTMLSLDVIKIFGTTQERQTAELIIETFIRRLDSTVTESKRIATQLANDRQRLLLEPQNRTPISTDVSIEAITAFKNESDGILNFAIKNLLAFLSPMHPDEQTPLGLEFEYIARSIAILDIKHLDRFSNDQKDSMGLMLSCDKIKTMLPTLLSPISDGFLFGKTAQKSMQDNLKLLVALFKLVDNMAKLSTMLFDAQQEESTIILQIRQILTLFNELIARCDAVDQPKMTYLQKSKVTFKKAMLEKYPQLFAPKSAESVKRLFIHPSTSVEGSESDSSTPSLTNQSSMASSVASSCPGTPPPELSRRGSFASLPDLTSHSPIAQSQLSPSKTHAASPTAPILQRSSSFFGALGSRGLKVKTAEEHDKNADGLKRYIEIRNSLIDRLLNELKASKPGFKPASFDEIRKAIIDANKNILIITAAVKVALQDKEIAHELLSEPMPVVKLTRFQLSQIYHEEMEFLANTLDDLQAFGSTENGLAKELHAMLKKAFDEMNYTAKRFDATPVEALQPNARNLSPIRGASAPASTAPSPEKDTEASVTSRSYA